MKKNNKIIVSSLLFIGASTLSFASLSKPQEINRDARVYSDREVVMTPTEISATATSTPKGPAVINRHARVSSQRTNLITEEAVTTEKVSDVAMSQPTAAQLNRHN